jgi:Baculovirus 19 kDa protein conserved region
MGALVLLNPYRNQTMKLVQDHVNTLHFGAYVDVYDLSTPRRVERLFIVRPENVVLYNVGGALFHYLESASVLCPREFAIARFTRDDIASINDSGLFTTLCTNVNSLALVEHFLVLKEGQSDERIILSVDEIHYSVLDLINLLIYSGYVQLM